MAKCEDKRVQPGIELEAWTGGSGGSRQCTISRQHDQVYHCIKIVNKRGSKNYRVDVKGFIERDPPTLEFKHLASQLPGSRWETRGIFVRARTKKGYGTYSKEEASVRAIASTSGQETICTEFTYTPENEGSYPPVSLSFDVDF